MATEIRSFDEATLGDASRVVAEMFSLGSCSLLDKILANPIRSNSGAFSSGDIAYQDGVPMAFQAAIVRRIYLGKSSFVGVVGSTLCSKPQTSPVLLMQLMKRTIAPRYGSKLFLASTAIPTSAKMNKMLGVKGVGPETNQIVRFAVLRWGAFLNILCKGHIPLLCRKALDLAGRSLKFWRKQKTGLKVSLDKKFDSAYDDFWKRYLDKNTGIVASRTEEELTWMFGEDVAKGRAVLISLRDNIGIVGYIIARAMDKSLERWMLVDWIAWENNSDVLQDLFSVLMVRLGEMYVPVWLESIGFNLLADKVLQRCMMFRRKLKENVYLYKPFDAEISKSLAEGRDIGWFFGPYDGDRCL